MRDAKKPMTGIYPGAGCQNPDATNQRPAKNRTRDYVPKKGDQRRGVGSGGMP